MIEKCEQCKFQCSLYKSVKNFCPKFKPNIGSIPLPIENITVLINHGSTDTIFINTSLPNPSWPFKNDLCFKTEAVKDTGVEYVKQNFNIEPIIIDGELT